MRELLLDPVFFGYVKNTTGLSGEQLTLVGNAIYLVAVNEAVPTIKQLSHYEGMSQAVFRKNMEEALGEVYYNHGLPLCHEAAWDARPSIEEFLYPLAAGLIELGFWTATKEEPRERAFARTKLSMMFFPGCYTMKIKNKAEFRGYLTLLEYVWMTLNGTELRPGQWLSQRYGGNSQPSKNLKAYLSLVIKQDSPFLPLSKTSFVGASMKPTMLLTGIRQEVVKFWEEYHQNPLS